MKTRLIMLVLMLWMGFITYSQEVIPFDTTNWDIQARSYVIENYKGQNAIYLQAGIITLKDVTLQDGTIEFDIFLKEEASFPGLYFRANEETGDAEQFYVRPHQSGNPDSNQAAPLVKGISPWQLYFGARYSFPYEYKFDDWTHIKILVLGRKAQVFMDYSEKANLSWDLFHEPYNGKIGIRGGGQSGFHIANVRVSTEAPDLKDFNPIEKAPIEGLITEWQVSDMFEEKMLADPSSYNSLINKRKWQGKIEIEEGTAANISRIQKLRDGTPGNTVFARIDITSESDQIKFLEFGYSDRVVAILNGKPIYWGTNKWRSRDYRYLGTVGLFDGIYLDLKKGKNELLMAVSEDFGGWLITGRIKAMEGVKIK